jgi:MoaA/NifB/PqqE/SkfB family radical SAM enzyme
MERSAFPGLDEPEAPAGTVPLRSVFLHVTKACNLSCDYCYFAARRPLPDELTTAEYARLWPDLVAVRPAKVIFTGGEPLLRPDLLDLLRGLKAADPEHCVTRCLNSNGQLVTPELARALVGLADEVRVSLDGLEARNDRHRGAGSFAAAVRALETYYAVGFEPKVLVTVTRESLPDLEDLLVFLFDRQIRRVNVNPFLPIGRGSSHGDWQVDAAAVTAAIQRANARCFPDRLLPPPRRPPNGCLNCGVGQFLNVMPNGDVYPCHVLTYPELRLGNLRERSLVELCRRGGLLGDLQALDFADLADRDPALGPLATTTTCLGPVYAATRGQPIWPTNVRWLGSRRSSQPRPADVQS